MSKPARSALLAFPLTTLAVAILVAVSGTSLSAAPAEEAGPRGTSPATCERWFELLAVLVACDGRLSRDFVIADGAGRGFQLIRPFRMARLLGAVLAPDDRVTLSGTASKETQLAVLVVTRSGRAFLVRFDDLGLRYGGRSVLRVTGSRDAPTFRLQKAGGRVVAPAGVVPLPGRRYVADLVVRRSGRKLEVAFTAAGTTAEVELLGSEAMEGLVKENEIEDVLFLRTIPTSPGKRIRIFVPVHAGAEFVFVAPLARRGQVLPALAPIPRG